KVVVEGIETQEEIDILQKIGFQQMQGYFFSHPLTTEDAGLLLANSIETAT
ncbi:MAG: EAL domain-containing protein, partial [Cyanobacteria bacterium J06636_16]